MYARVVSGSARPDQLDELIQLWQDSVAPSVKTRKGFKSARLLVDRHTGRAMSVGFWAAQPDVQETSEWNRAQVAKFMELFIAPPSVEENYEIVVEV